MNLLNSAKIVLRYGAIRQRLMDEPYNYTRSDVMHTVKRLLRIDPDIQYAFVQWFVHGETPQVSYGGFSFSDLTELKGFNEFNAFLFLDALKCDAPSAQFLLIQQTESLQTLRPEELRTSIRSDIAREMKEKTHSEDVFDDLDEFSIEPGKSLRFHLHKHQTQ